MVLRTYMRVYACCGHHRFGPTFQGSGRSGCRCCRACRRYVAHLWMQGARRYGTGLFCRSLCGGPEVCSVSWGVLGLGSETDAEAEGETRRLPFSRIGPCFKKQKAQGTDLLARQPDCSDLSPLLARNRQEIKSARHRWSQLLLSVSDCLGWLEEVKARRCRSPCATSGRPLACVRSTKNAWRKRVAWAPSLSCGAGNSNTRPRGSAPSTSLGLKGCLE